MFRHQLQKSDSSWLVAVAAVLVLQFWWLPGDPGTADDSYSTGVEGKRGIYQVLELLSREGVLPPVYRETASLVPDRTATLLLLSPDRYPNTHEQQELADWVSSGGTLLFTPNWNDPESTMVPLRISLNGRAGGDDGSLARSTAPISESATETDDAEAAGSTDNNSTAGSLPAEAEESNATVPPLPDSSTPDDESDRPDADVMLESGPPAVPVSPAQAQPVPAEEKRVVVPELLASGPLAPGGVRWRTRAAVQLPAGRSTVLLSTEGGDPQVAAWPLGSGLVVVSASPDVFSNRSLLDENKAELAVRLVEYADQHHPRTSSQRPAIVVNEFLNASDSYRGTAVLLSPGLRSGTLQLILIAVLAGWYGFHRFGPALKANHSQRRSLTESAIAVGNLQFRAEGGSESVHCYLEYLRSSLRRLFAGTVRLEDSSALSHRTGLDADEVRRRVQAAEEAAGGGTTNPAGAAQAIRDLADLHGRLTGSCEWQQTEQSEHPDRTRAPT